MSPSPDLYEPLRSWDELLDDVVSRGDRLRRRRLAVRGAAVLAVVGLAITTASSLGDSRGPSSMQVLTTDPGPTTTVQPHQRDLPQPADPTARGSSGGPSRARSTAPQAAPPATTRSAPTQLPVVLPATSPALSYSDPRGDVTGAGVDATSESADITGMAFRSSPAGLVVRMELLGYQDTNHHYLATLHSARSGCDLQLLLDAAGPVATVVCNGSTVWSHPLTPYADATQLQVTLPWDSFPRQVTATEPLTTSGKVVVASADVVVDTASDPRTITPRSQP